MKLIFKQKLLSLLDSYDIYNEFGKVEFTIKSEFGLTHKFRIYNNKNIELAYIKQSMFTILPRFKMYINNNYIGSVKKELSILKPMFTLDCKGWTVEGNFLELDYKIKDESNNIVATIDKKLFSLTDKYEINIKDREDTLCSLVIVLAIDAIKCCESKNNN